jgi:hypothetical protein
MKCVFVLKELIRDFRDGFYLKLAVLFDRNNRKMCMLTSLALSSEPHPGPVESPAERVLRLVNQIAVADSHDPPRQPPQFDILYPVRNSQMMLDMPLDKCPARVFNLTKCLSEPDFSRRSPRTMSTVFPWRKIANFGSLKRSGPDQMTIPQVHLEQSTEPNTLTGGGGCPYHELKIRWRKQQILQLQTLESSSSGWFDWLTMRGRSHSWQRENVNHCHVSRSNAWWTRRKGHGKR